MGTVKAVIVGGGIAGLSSAIALHRHGWDVEVLERAPTISEVGSGLTLWSNALGALDVLGLGDQVRGSSSLEGSGGIRDSRGRWLSRTDVAAIRERFGDIAMIHRATLLDILRSALPPEALRVGVSVDGASPEGSVRHSQGSSEGDLVVGADGLRSEVRRALWPDSEPRYAGYTAWRFVTAFPADFGPGFESWGRGQRFGCTRLQDGRVYCFAVLDSAEGTASIGLAALRQRFATWHDPVPALLAATNEADLLHHDLYDIPALPTYVHDKVALVGDAAHAMTPNLGQGACQALEDAVALAEAAQGDDLAAYDARRRPQATMVSQRSARIGRVAQWHWPPAVALRDTLLRLTPESAFLRSLEPVLGPQRS